MTLEDIENIPRFHDRIRQIGDSVNDPDLYLNIEKACREKQAFLFSEQNSFAVLTFKQNSLLIWIAFSDMRSGLKNYFPKFEQMAREVGATSIEFWSARKGFARILTHEWTSTSSEWNGAPITVWRKLL